MLGRGQMEQEKNVRGFTVISLGGVPDMGLTDLGLASLNNLGGLLGVETVSGCRVPTFSGVFRAASSGPEHESL